MVPRLVAHRSLEIAHPYPTPKAFNACQTLVISRSGAFWARQGTGAATDIWRNSSDNPKHFAVAYARPTSFDGAWAETIRKDTSSRNDPSWCLLHQRDEIRKFSSPQDAIFAVEVYLEGLMDHPLDTAAEVILKC